MITGFPSDYTGLLRVSKNTDLVHPDRDRFDVQLSIAAPGFVAIETWLCDGGESVDSPRQIELQPEMVLDVVVTDQNGMPKREALVVAYQARPANPYRSAGEPESRYPRPIQVKRDAVVGSRINSLKKSQARTDSSGVARLSGISLATVIELAVLVRGRVQFHGEVPIHPRLDGSGSSVVALGSTAECRGVLRDGTASPIAHQDIALVAANVLSAGTELPKYLYFTRLDRSWGTTTTDDAGRFSFDGVPSGLWYCGPRDSDETDCWGTLEVPDLGSLFEVGPSGEDVDLSMSVPRGLFISGTVRGGDGSPLEGIMVLAKSESASGHLSVQSGASGEFCLGPLADGEFLLTTVSLDYAAMTPRPARSGDRGLEFILNAAVALRLLVQDGGSGQPRLVETVWLKSGAAEKRFEMQGSSTEVAVPFLSDEMHAVLVCTTGGAFAWKDEIRAVARGRALRLRAAAGGSIHVEGSGSATRVTATFRGVQVLDAALSELPGQTFCAPAGDVVVVLAAPGRVSFSTTLRVEPGQVAHITAP